MVALDDIVWEADEERETAGSLAALGMTTRKAKIKAKANGEGRIKAIAVGSHYSAHQRHHAIL